MTVATVLGGKEAAMVLGGCVNWRWEGGRREGVAGGGIKREEKRNYSIS